MDALRKAQTKFKCLKYKTSNRWRFLLVNKARIYVMPIIYSVPKRQKWGPLMLSWGKYSVPRTPLVNEKPATAATASLHCCFPALSLQKSDTCIQQVKLFLNQHIGREKITFGWNVFMGDKMSPINTEEQRKNRNMTIGSRKTKHSSFDQHANL